MQYLIQASGSISERQSKTYVIDAEDETHAQDIAEQYFYNDYATSCDEIRIQQNARSKVAIISFVCMLVPIFLSFISWKNNHDSINISPDFLSCLYGVLLYSGFIVRFKGIRRTVCSWIDIVSCVIAVLLLASFVKVILVKETLFWGISFDSKVVFPVAILLSWLGVKFMSLLCIAAVAVVALFNITGLSESMGALWGPLYIICAFIGIMLYLSVEPAFTESAYQFKRVVAKGITQLGNDKDQVTMMISNKIKKINQERNEEKLEDENLD